MYTVLTQDVKGLGYKGDVVNVKRGYFVNFLYPNGLAEFASEGAVKRTSTERKERVLRAEELRKRAQEISEQLESFVLELTVKTSSKGKLYGSIDEKAIAEALAKQAKIEVSPDQVEMAEHFKTVGDYKVNLKLTDNIIVSIGVKLEAEEASE